VPLSNLVVESKSAWSQPAQWKMPARFSVLSELGLPFRVGQLEGKITFAGHNGIGPAP